MKKENIIECEEDVCQRIQCPNCESFSLRLIGFIYHKQFWEINLECFNPACGLIFKKDLEINQINLN